MYNIPIECGIPMKLVRPIKMCLNETCSKVPVGNHLSDMFPIKNGLKQGDALLTNDERGTWEIKSRIPMRKAGFNNT